MKKLNVVDDIISMKNNIFKSIVTCYKEYMHAVVGRKWRSRKRRKKHTILLSVKFSFLYKMIGSVTVHTKFLRKYTEKGATFCEALKTSR